MSYFLIAYLCSTIVGQAVGNYTVQVSGKELSLSGVQRSVEKDQGCQNVVILNFQPISKKQFEEMHWVKK